MASKNTRPNSVALSDSGYGSNSDPRTPVTINPKYACYWLETCRGMHEQCDCHAWSNELTGKLGIYYSPTGFYRSFRIDQINKKSLKTNPTGSVLMSLLIHRYENDEVKVLFITKFCRDRNQTKSWREKQRRFQLSFPSSKTYIKGESGESVARRAMKSITNRSEFIDNLSRFLKRFLFVNANVIYPIKLSEEEIVLLNQHLSLDSEMESVRWISLNEIVRNIRPQKIVISPALIDDEISQSDLNAELHRDINLTVESNRYELDPLTAFCLASIERVVGFDEFLEIKTP